MHHLFGVVVVVVVVMVVVVMVVVVGGGVWPVHILRIHRAKNPEPRFLGSPSCSGELQVLSL